MLSSFGHRLLRLRNDNVVHYPVEHPLYQAWNRVEKVQHTCPWRRTITHKTLSCLKEQFSFEYGLQHK